MEARSGIVERLRACVPCDEYDHVKCDAIFTEAADEIERLEAKCVQVDRYIALLNDEIADNGMLRDEIERLKERIADLEEQLLRALGEQR